ncbi:hypothetical protein BDY24DRAFT_390507 [Mrakia frigida]|uniref:uncharacterized protein n=1 Tax=Mrakia frigida TaxID=29902 RepID=UPI003FCC0840
MRLRSFSVAKVIPVEVIHLIIHESDSVSALKAWCLVSKGTLSVAGPILMREVVLTRSKDICPFLLHRFNLPSPPSSPSSSSPLVQQYLSTKHTLFLDLPQAETADMDLFQERAVQNARGRQTRLTLSLSVVNVDLEDPLVDEESEYEIVSWIAAVVYWLQPMRFNELGADSQVIRAFSPSITSDYQELILPDQTRDDLLSNHRLLIEVQLSEEKAIRQLDLLDFLATICTREEMETSETFIQALDLAESSETTDLREVFRRIRAGDDWAEEEKPRSRSRLASRMAWLVSLAPRVNRVIFTMNALGCTYPSVGTLTLFFPLLTRLVIFF